MANEQNRICIKLFAIARQLANVDAVEIELPANATLAQLQQQLVKQCPALAATVTQSRWAVNGAYATLNDTIPLAADVALIPPVSGG